MGHPKHQASVTPLKAGTGTSELAPPWSRSQVRWLGRGYFVLRLATDETSRWLLGAGFDWNDVFPHERTFRRSAADKCEAMRQLKMNPWPVHLAGAVDPVRWRELLSELVDDRVSESKRGKSGSLKVYDTGHVTLWRVPQVPRELISVGQFVVLDGHHSRRAQRNLGLKRMFGWFEPLGAPQLSVRAINRAGALARWLDDCLTSGELRLLEQPPEIAEWTMQKSLAFEVVQARKRFWCEVARSHPNETVVDVLTRLAKGRVYLKTSSSFDEILEWIEGFDVDTGLRLPPPTKEFVLARALGRQLLPQKATYFHPKIPFGLLVEDLK